MPCLGCILAFGQSIKLVEKEGGNWRGEKASLGIQQPNNPWVTTGEAPMSAHIKATGIVFKSTGAVPLSFQCAGAH